MYSWLVSPGVYYADIWCQSVLYWGCMNMSGPAILTSIAGNYLFQRYGIVDTTSGGHPAILKLHFTWVLGAHNSGIMGYIPTQYGAITCIERVFLFQLPVQCWRNYIDGTNFMKSKKITLFWSNQNIIYTRIWCEYCIKSRMCLGGKLSWNNVPCDLYRDVFCDYVQECFIAEVSHHHSGVQGPCWVHYMPHHLLLKEYSTTAKFKPFFNVLANRPNGYFLMIVWRQSQVSFLTYSGFLLGSHGGQWL